MHRYLRNDQVVGQTERKAQNDHEAADHGGALDDDARNVLAPCQLLEDDALDEQRITNRQC